MPALTPGPSPAGRGEVLEADEPMFISLLDIDRGNRDKYSDP